MTILVTGSSGHLGEALMRTLREQRRDAAGADLVASPYTNFTGSIADRDFVKKCLRGVKTVIHTATLHKPHVESHSRQDFIDTNVTGTSHLLEEAVAAGVTSFIFTSTTSTFGHALTPPLGAPTAWITEDVRPVPKNIYGVTKVAAEDLCELFHRLYALPCLVLRTSRFFPEADDNERARAAFVDVNLKTIEFLHRRVEIEDVVNAHLLAAKRAPEIGFARYIISATTPFSKDDLIALRTAASAVIEKCVPGSAQVFAARDWKLPSSLDRVYVNDKARVGLGWNPKYDFARIVTSLIAGDDPRSPLARAIGSKGYFK